MQADNGTVRSVLGSEMDEDHGPACKIRIGGHMPHIHAEQVAQAVPKLGFAEYLIPTS